MRKPLIPENRTDKDDIINIYNPNKHLNNIGNYQKKDEGTKKLKQVDSKATTKDDGKKTKSELV